LIYLDTSAFFKTVRNEPQSSALWAYLSTITSPAYVSSTLLSVEARRSALRNDPRLLPRTDLALGRVQQVEMSATVLETAGRLRLSEFSWGRHACRVPVPQPRKIHG